MKQSTYNYIVENGDSTIFYNGISELFFEVATSKANIYSEIISKPDQYKETFESFISKMKSNGFILEDETDEWELVEKKFKRALNEDLCHLMILPTYQCNLRCWYCTQEHKNLNMDEDIIGRVKELIATRISSPEIKRIRLSWFGGEPMLRFNLVSELTKYTRQLAEQLEKPFICDVTTNSTLLNRKRIEILHEAGVTYYQITIDGEKSVHDSIKQLPKGSAFDKAIENINIIAEHSKVYLRFNYTHENLSPIEIFRDLKSKIKQESIRNIIFTPFKVWQENEENINLQKVDNLLQLSKEMGIRPQLPMSGMCYADNPNFDCIFPNGTIEKCDNESPLKAKGRLGHGEIIWNGNIDDHTPAFLNDAFPCRKCKYLPICWGPCISKRTYMLREGGTPGCYRREKDAEFRTIIRNAYQNFKIFKELNQST